MTDESALPRRVPWRGSRDIGTDPRARIVEAASRCLVKVGLDRTSLSAIAREAGVSRQTIYNYFTSKDEIVNAAVESAAAEATERIIATARTEATAADFVVELCLTAIGEFHRNPAISPLIALLEDAGIRRNALSPEIIATARHFLEPILTYEPDCLSRLDEMTETYLRFELSLLTIDSVHTQSPEALRGYLHRVLVPALGLPPA